MKRSHIGAPPLWKILCSNIFLRAPVSQGPWDFPNPHVCAAPGWATIKDRSSLE
uniref:Uncharacterized protein n=1 Tax=Anguilla anguilla TaxID=7936 RepID=A0A0E9TT59_ANGAN